MLTPTTRKTWAMVFLPVVLAVMTMPAAGQSEQAAPPPAESESTHRYPPASGPPANSTASISPAAAHVTAASRA